MIDDARVVLEWMGRTQEPMPTFGHNGDNSWTRTEGRFKIDFRIDANWIIGTLVPALEKRLRLKTFVATHHMDGFWIVALNVHHEGTGPTFEAAFLAAAAAAIRSMSDE